jgi:hypothetical protein
VLREKASRQAVRGDHQVFDHLLGAGSFARGKFDQRVAVEHRTSLPRLEGEGAMLATHRVHGLFHAILQAALLVNSRHLGDRRRWSRRAVEPRCHAVVRQPGALNHDGAIDRGLPDRSVRCNDHLRHHRQSFLRGGQRRAIGRQHLREHREDLGGGVDRRGVGPGVAVHRGADRDERIDVGDGNKDLHRTVGERLGVRQLVEIARIVVVDRGSRGGRAGRGSTGRCREGGRGGSREWRSRGPVRRLACVEM